MLSIASRPMLSKALKEKDTQIKALQDDLDRKDKALAEGYEEKATGDLGGSKEKMISATDRLSPHELINEVKANALSKICKERGIDERIDFR